MVVRPRRFAVALVAALTVLGAAPAAVSANPSPRPPTELRVNSVADPIGIETPPSFSWNPGVARQTAYQIQVADVWDSGRVASAESIRVPFPGRTQAQTRYTWRVRVWDGAGRPSAWSRSAVWEMGLTGGEPDWRGAAWLGGRSPEDHNWTDLRASVTFRGDDPARGLEFLTRAEPVGKTWGEALSWSIRSNPVGSSELTRAGQAGDTRVHVDGVSGWQAGDVITIDRRGPHAQRTTVASVGTATVDLPLFTSVPAGATAVAVRGVAGLVAGDEVTVNGEPVRVTSVGQGAITVVGFTPALTKAANTSARLFRLGSGLTLADPLTAAHPAGTRLLGAGHLQLVMRTNHYAGNTWVDGSGEPEWGVNQHDPQSQANPTTVGTRSVPIATIDLPEATGLTFDNFDTRDHTVALDITGLTVTTTVNGSTVDIRTLGGDQIRRNGSIGFGAGSSATVREVTATGEGGGRFHADLRTGANPFESGIGGAGGLTFVEKNAMLPIANPAPLLRTRQALPAGRISSARLYLATAGFADLTVNGQQITVDGEPVRADGTNVPRMLTDQATYDRTVLYDTFDVTHLVKAGGTNVVAAELGRGWYGVTTPTEWYWHLAPYVGAPRMRARLVATYTDGRTAEIRTDRSWETADGPTTFDSVYSGEKYDARIAAERGHWRTGASSPGWRPATVMLAPGSCSAPRPGCHGRVSDTERPAGFIPAQLRAAEAEPVRVLESLRPRTLRETAPDVYVADFGQILTGFPVLTLSGIRPTAAGQTIRIRGGNDVTGAGTVGEENVFHDANLQTGYYTLSGAPRQVWEPDFNNWGFRYVEIRNLRAALGRAPDAGLLRVDVARSGFARTGRFATDNPLLGRINQNLEWAQQNNNVGKPTDTPSREKNGWTGDTMADSETQSLIWDVEAALHKYLRGFPDAQLDSGQVPMILPAAKGGYGYDRTPGWNATWQAVPAWDSALFLIPWELHRYYGSTDLFAELYPMQDKLLRYYETLFTPANDYTFTAALGAYSGAESPGSNAVISLQMYIRFCDYMASVGDMVGQSERASYYAGKAATLRAAFIRKYWDPTVGYFTRGSISSENTLAIAWNLVPGSDLAPDDPLHLPGTATQAENEKRLAKLLADRIVAAEYHIQNDMYGSRYEFGILDEYGYTDVVLRAVTQTGAPGYVDQIAHDATSLWESWTGGSLNHHYRGNVATWFYQGLAGITPTAPAYASVRIRPHVPRTAVNAEVPTTPDDTNLATRPLGRVDAAIDTVRGKIASGWQRLPDGRIRLTVTIPANTRAEIWVPTTGRTVTAPRGATFVKNTTTSGAAYAVYLVEHGTYRFN